MKLTSQLLLLHCYDFLDKRVIEHGVFTPYWQECDLIQVVTETYELAQSTLEAKQLTILLSFENIKSDLKLTLDIRRLQQVLLNLLTNAIKF